MKALRLAAIFCVGILIIAFMFRLLPSNVPDSGSVPQPAPAPSVRNYQ